VGDGVDNCGDNSDEDGRWATCHVGHCYGLKLPVGVDKNRFNVAPNKRPAFDGHECIGNTCDETRIMLAKATGYKVDVGRPDMFSPAFVWSGDPSTTTTCIFPKRSGA